MAAAETAKLIASLELKDNLTKGVNSAIASVGRLETRFGRLGQGIGTVGRGIGTALRNGALLGVAALGGLSALLINSVKEGQAAAKVQTVYATAIANSGKVSQQYVAALNAQQTALMNLGGVDDELIKTEQTRLIQMGLTGAQVQKLTPLILDMSKATGRDLLTTTLAVGKAVNGNATGLQRYGVVIDKTKAKTDAFGAVQDALNQKFGGTTQALSGTLEARLGALRENLSNIREEAGIKLLPALTRIVDVAGKDLVPAFGKFVDRILPSVIAGVDKFASLLENGGAERGIKAITDALSPMVDMLKIAAEPVKAIVKAFLSLPSQVQGILIGGFAINKLSGGLIGQGLGQIAGGLFQRGSTPANPLFVADVTGGLGGAAAAAGGIGLGTIAAGATVVGGTGLLLAAAQGAFDKSSQAEQNVSDFVNGRRTGFKVALDDAAIAALKGTEMNTGKMADDLIKPQMFSLSGKAEDDIAAAVAIGTERGIVHSGVFKKAQAIREAAGFRLSRDALIAELHKGGGLGSSALISAEAIALASGNKLRNDPNAKNLASAATNLALLQRTQSHLPADLAAKLDPKIHSLEAAIKQAQPIVNVTVNISASNVTQSIVKRLRIAKNNNPRTTQTGPLVAG